MTDGNELLHAMQQFTGSQTLYRHSLVRAFTYTEGVQFFARNAGHGAYWLLDLLATQPQVRNEVMENGFAAVKLTVRGRVADLLVTDGNTKIVLERHIDFTDCPEQPRTESDPEGVWMFFIEPNQLGDGTICMTMMWPSER